MAPGPAYGNASPDAGSQATSTSGSTPPASLAVGVANAIGVPPGNASATMSAGTLAASMLGGRVSRTLTKKSTVPRTPFDPVAEHDTGAGPAGALKISRPIVDPSAGVQPTGTAAAPSVACTKSAGNVAPAGPEASNVDVSPVVRLKRGWVRSRMTCSRFTLSSTCPVLAACDANT